MFKLFAQIRKVDEAQRLVFGRAAQEVADKSGEIMDYASSKPHFQKWSEDVNKDTDGKSLGNVRAMHGKVAAGKLTQIDFNDADMAVDVCAKIVDDQEWKKVLEGVYTGFSIGGSYVGDKKVEKINGKDVTRYTAKPSELSLVDRPCIPSAKFFEVQKADGTLEKVEFHPAAPTRAEMIEELAKAGGGEDLAKCSDEEVAAKHAELVAKRADEPTGEVEGTPEQVDQLTKLMSDNKLNMEAVIKAVEAVVEKKEFSDAKREKDTKAGKAMSDGSYPIENVADLHNAIQAYGRASNPEAVKKHIKERAKALGAEKELPEDWNKMEKADEAPEGIGQEKWDSMTDEERTKYKAGLKAGTEPDGDEAEKLAKAATEWQASLSKVEDALADALTKVGARNSAADKSRINAIHNAAAELGADCPMAGKGEAKGALQKADEASLQKLVADAVAPLQKALVEANEKIAKLEAQPAPTRVVLRAVGKGEDHEDLKKKEEIKPIVDGTGEAHEAAGLIKGLHQTGGAPLLQLSK